MIKFSRKFLLSSLLLCPCSGVAQEAFVLQQPNGYVSIEGVVDVKNVAYAKPEGAIAIDANDDGLEDL